MVIKINYTSSDIYVSTSVSPVYVVVSNGGSNGSAVWGQITGTLSNQTDLQNALDAKFDDPTGTIAQYLRGDGTLATFPSLTGFVPYTGATTNVNLGEFALSAGQVTLDTSPTGTAAVATTRWNDTNGVSETTLKGGSVVLKNGMDLVARVVNKVTPNATLTKAAYQAVRVSGAQGQRLAVALAQANNDANSADTIGLVTETIATNQEGFIMTVGQLENINTTGSLQGETWVDGDVLYLSPTTAGAITKVKPTGNGHIVVIGYVEYAHANNGKIYVKVMNGWELDELHDVDIVTPANNEALIYESSTSLWKNKTIATALGFTPVTSARLINTTSPLVGGGDLSADRTLSIPAATTSVNGYLTSTDWTTFNSKQNALGFTPVPTTRTLTINGTTQDLSADRTFTVSAANIYTADGTLSGNRSLTHGGFNLSFIGGTFTNRFTSAGRLLLGTTTEGTNILEVNGTARVNTDLYVHNASGEARIEIGRSITGARTVLFSNFSAGLVYYNSGFSNYVYYYDPSTNTLLFQTNGSDRLTIASTGAATFSSSVTASSLIKSGGTSAQILAADGSVITAGTNITISGGTISTSGGGTTIYTGDGTLAGNRSLTHGGFNLSFIGGTFTNRFTSAGRLLLGTTTEGTFLADINGTARVSGGIVYSGGSYVAGSIYYSSSLGIVIAGNTGSGSDLTLTDRSGSERIKIISGGFVTLTASSINGVEIGSGSISSNISNSSQYGLQIWGRTSSTSNYAIQMYSDGGSNGVFIGNNGNLVIGALSTTNVSTAILQANSTTKGFLPPRMTNAQRAAISSPAVGLIVYCTDATEGLYQYTSAGWANLNGIVTNRQTASYTLALTDINDLVEMRCVEISGAI